jgi:hypothetical protein
VAIGRKYDGIPSEETHDAAEAIRDIRGAEVQALNRTQHELALSRR